MFSLAKIVFPVDFSERSASAAGRVASLAARFGSVVTILHVLPPPHYEFSALEVGGTVLNELFANRAKQVAQELEGYLAHAMRGVEVKRVLLEGDPARKIVEHAGAEGANLIVMPTHGYGSFRRFILGSVTAKVLHDADCPVWTGVHMEQAPSEQLDVRRIVCGLDLGPQSAKTLRWAGAMAKACEAALTVVHVVPAMAESGEAAQSECAREMREQASSALARVMEETGVRAEVEMAAGDAPKGVCALAGQARADLVVIARGSAAGVFGRLRTNAYAIIRQSPCPVVSV